MPLLWICHAPLPALRVSGRFGNEAEEQGIPKCQRVLRWPHVLPSWLLARYKAAGIDAATLGPSRQQLHDGKTTSAELACIIRWRYGPKYDDELTPDWSIEAQFMRSLFHNALDAFLIRIEHVWLAPLGTKVFQSNRTFVHDRRVRQMGHKDKARGFMGWPHRFAVGAIDYAGSHLRDLTFTPLHSDRQVPLGSILSQVDAFDVPFLRLPHAVSSLVVAGM